MSSERGKCDCRVLILDSGFAYEPEIPEGGRIEIQYCKKHSAPDEAPAPPVSLQELREWATQYELLSEFASTQDQERIYERRAAKLRAVADWWERQGK